MEKPAAAKRRNTNRSMISEILPEPILHHILSLLSQKDAVRTCVLSKSWRHLWYARPQINFRRSDFDCRCSPNKTKCRCCFQEKKNTFFYALEKTLQGYHNQKLSIESIELEMFEVNPQWTSLLQKWIPILIVPNNMLLKTFSLCFSPISSTRYFDLPWVVFEVKTLKKLCLQTCSVNHPTGGDKVLLLESLQTLSLKSVFIEVATLEMLISSCPLIENVVVEDCTVLRAPKVIRIKHNNLKHLSFSAFLRYIHADCPGIEIDAPNLISLFLEGVQLYTNYFENLSSNLPLLEDLSVLSCYGHGELKLSSRSIKRVALSAIHRNSIKATIDVPNLHVFKFTGDFQHASASLTFATTSSEWKKSHVVMDLFDDGDLRWFLNLGELLRALSKSQISLEASYNHDFLSNYQHIEEGGFNRDEPVVVVENLLLYSPVSLPHFLNGMFSVCRPRYTQTIYNDNQLFDFLCKVLVQEREKRDYFWQKDLEEVDVEVWDKNTNEWNPTSFLPDYEMPCKQDIRFRMKWSADSGSVI